MPTRRSHVSTLPAGYAREVIDLCARFDVAPAAVVAGSGVSLETLADPTARLDLAAFEHLLRRARELTHEPGLAFYAGLHMRVSWHGFLGFAAMTAGSLREALELAERFGRTRSDAVALVTRVRGDDASVVIEERVALGTLREHLVTALLVGLATIGEALVGRSVPGHLEVRHAEPPYFARFLEAVPALSAMRFAQSHDRLVFPKSALDLPIVSADGAATSLAREQCERELAALGDGAHLQDRVRALVRDGFPTLERVARRLFVSPRTLKRRLAEQGTTFSDVVDDVRRREALLLLDDRRLSVDEIALRLGYSDTANFSRAFRRWTGRTPGGVRRGHGSA